MRKLFNNNEICLINPDDFCLNPESCIFRLLTRKLNHDHLKIPNWGMAEMIQFSLKLKQQQQQQQTNKQTKTNKKNSKQL